MTTPRPRWTAEMTGDDKTDRALQAAGAALNEYERKVTALETESAGRLEAVGHLTGGLAELHEYALTLEARLSQAATALQEIRDEYDDTQQVPLHEPDWDAKDANEQRALLLEWVLDRFAAAGLLPTPQPGHTAELLADYLADHDEQTP